MNTEQSVNPPPAASPNPQPVLRPVLQSLLHEGGSDSGDGGSTISADTKPGTLSGESSILSSKVLCTNEEALLAKDHQAPALVEAKPLAAAATPRKIRRNGRIASLPRLQRDMVNHMLWNAVPYKNIVAALDDAGFIVTERNISNWATGGYLEWCLAQEHVLQNRLDQDQLLDFLRRDDAPELPEVGLQAAATRLSQVFLQKLARADDPEAHLENFDTLVDLLCRLNREIAATQKQRDDSRRTLGREYDPALVKDEEQLSAIEDERFYSNPPSDSTLSGPPVPPVLPPIPTATMMAQQAREDRHDAEMQRIKENRRRLQAIKATIARASEQTPATPAPPPVTAR